MYNILYNVYYIEYIMKGIKMIESIFEKVFLVYLAVFPLIPTEINEKLKLDYLLIALFMISFFIKSIYCKEERKVFKKRLLDVVKDPIVIMMTFSIIIMVISSTYAVNISRAITESFRFFTYIILYIAIKYEFNIKRNFTKFMKIFLGQSFVVFILGIVQKITNIGVTVETNGVYRMESTLGYPTAYGAYIVIVIFPLLIFMLKSKNFKLKVFTAITIFFGMISLVLSYSRNAWLALGVGLLILAIIYNYKFIYALLGAGIFGIAIPFLRERLIQLASSSINGGRIKLWKIAVKMIKEHPVKGIGQGNYVDLVDSYFERYPNLYELGHEGFPTHNSYLKELCEIGIIGAIVFFSTYVIMGIKLFMINKKYSNEYLGLTIGVCASFISFMFINMFDNMMFTPKVMTMFVVLVSLCITIDSKEIYK